MAKYIIYAMKESNVGSMTKYITDHAYDAEIEVVSDAESIAWEACENICIEWLCRYDVLDHLIANRQKVRIYFFNERFISEVKDVTQLEIVLKKALETKDWDTCKDLNEFFIFREVIYENSCLNSYPMKLQLETTDLCNAKCIMCSHMYNKGTGIDILSSGVLDKLEHVFPYLRVMILHGNGEPFLNKKLITYLDRMAAYNIKFITNTNMSIIYPELLERIKNSFVELNVSCDAADKEMYESIRVGLKYEAFIENVKLVRKFCPQLRMRMMVVVMRRNLNQLAQIVRLADELGFDEVVFNQLCTDEKNNNLNEAAYLYPEELRRYTKEAMKEGETRRINVVVPYPFETEKHIGSSISVDNLVAGGICDWLVECPYIDLRGNIGMCCIQQNEIMGNIFEQNFDEIWNGHRYQEVRMKFWEHILPETCKGCDFITQKRLRYLYLSVMGEDVLYKNRRG